MSGRWSTRAERVTDVPVIRAINLVAFPTAAEADLVDSLRADPTAWIEGLSIVVAGATGPIVGYALLTRCHVGHVPALCLAPVAVHPEQQRLGAGSAAARAALQAAADMGEHTVVVLGDPAYYARFGFTRSSAHGISLPVEASDEAAMALSLDRERTLPRGVVRYAAAFGI